MNSAKPERNHQAPLAINPLADHADKGGGTQSPLSLATMRLPWAAGLLMLVLLAIVNTVAVPFGENISGPPEGLELILFSVGLGLIGGQIGGLSVVLVWRPGPFLIRCVLIWLVGLSLFVCWWLGLLMAIPRDDWFADFRFDIARAILASLPLISLAVQLPQWLARFYFGWRIEPASSANPAVSGLSIRDLLIGTAVTALTITAVRFSQDADEMTTTVWVAWAIAVGVIVVISAIAMLPLLVLILRSKYPLWAILYVSVGSPLLAGLSICVIALVDRRGGTPNARDVAMFLIASTTCVAVTSIPLWLARWAGYRLKFSGEA